MKKQFLFLSLVCFLASCVPCHSQNIALMNAVSASVTATYTAVATGKQGNLMISTNSAFNGTTASDSIIVASVNPLTGVITWAQAYHSDGTTPYVIALSSGAHTYTIDIQNADFNYWGIIHTKGNTSAGTETAVIMLK